MKILLDYLQINRMEFSGSLGDLGTILPLSVGMILINDMDPYGIFLCVGLFYILSGIYYRVTCPVEPMKVISGYAIASGISAMQIQSSCLLISLFLLVLGVTGLIDHIRKNIPLPVIRGVQLSTGTLLVSKGVQLIVGTSPFQKIHGAAEPFLMLQNIGPIPFGFIAGGLLFFLTLFLLNNTKVPAAVTIVGIGLVIGIILGTQKETGNLIQILPPHILPNGWPSGADFSFALIFLVLPQIPMTIGNAVIANSDLSAQYFPEAGKRVTPRSLCFSMALANFFSFLFGGMPMCHGAGGLASRYRFGARTAGSNLIIGFLFLALVVIFGRNIMQFINLIPMAVLGVLLIFAGIQLSLTLLDIRTRKDMFVITVMLGLTLATNLAVGFIIGIVVAYVVRIERFNI